MADAVAFSAAVEAGEFERAWELLADHEDLSPTTVAVCKLLRDCEVEGMSLRLSRGVE